MITRKLLYTKKRKEELVSIDYFNRKIRNTLNDLEPVIFQELQKIQEAEHETGLVSGRALHNLLTMFADKTISALMDNLSLIKELQDEKKFTFNKEQLDLIGQKHAELFSSYFMQIVDRYRKFCLSSSVDK
jgi:hypothetical protein